MNFSKTIDLDIEHYLFTINDLSELSESEANHHYLEFGYYELRANSKNVRREHFVEQFRTGKSLEIGPFANPVLKGTTVEYFDVLSTQQMRERAKSLGISPASVPAIKYVSPTGDLRIIGDRFDTVFSSHKIEHQPDLISRLNLVYELLEVGGAYAVIVPDFRYCFDTELPRTTISDVLNAFYERRTRHSVGMRS